MVSVTVNPHIANLCEPVRTAMESKGISHKRCLDACNAHLGRLALAKDKDGKDKVVSATTGAMKVNAKKGTAKITVKVGAIGFADTYNTVSVFLAWHSCIEQANEVAVFNTVDIPEHFNGWLEKFKATQPENAQP